MFQVLLTALLWAPHSEKYQMVDNFVQSYNESFHFEKAARMENAEIKQVHDSQFRCYRSLAWMPTTEAQGA